jgi:uncharacterized integral membrane protein
LASGDATGAEHDHSLPRSRAASLFVGVTIGAVAVLVMLVFVLQNEQRQRFEFLWWSASIRAGVALLLAAVLGALVVAFIAAARVIQLRRAANRLTEPIRQRGGDRDGRA